MGWVFPNEREIWSHRSASTIALLLNRLNLPLHLVGLLLPRNSSSRISVGLICCRNLQEDKSQQEKPQQAWSCNVFFLNPSLITYSRWSSSLASTSACGFCWVTKASIPDSQSPSCHDILKSWFWHVLYSQTAEHENNVNRTPGSHIYILNFLDNSRTSSSCRTVSDFHNWSNVLMSGFLKQGAWTHEVSVVTKSRGNIIMLIPLLELGLWVT